MIVRTSRTLRNGLSAAAALAAIGAVSPAAQAQGQLVLYCAVNEEWCRAASTAFERDTIPR